MRIVSVTKLKTCRLWKGSNLEISFQYGGLSLQECLNKIHILQQCDDRTKDEDELLQALIETVAELPTG